MSECKSLRLFCHVEAPGPRPNLNKTLRAMPLANSISSDILECSFVEKCTAHDTPFSTGTLCSALSNHVTN